MLKGLCKEETKKETESVCCEALSLSFFTPVTHVLLKGRSPDAGRQLDGAGRAFCMRSSPCAGGCSRAIGGQSLGVPAHFFCCVRCCGSILRRDKRAVLFLFFDDKDGHDSSYCDYIYRTIATIEQFVQTNHSKMNRSKLLSRQMQIS